MVVKGHGSFDPSKVISQSTEWSEGVVDLIPCEVFVSAAQILFSEAQSSVSHSQGVVSDSQVSVSDARDLADVRVLVSDARLFSSYAVVLLSNTRAFSFSRVGFSF